MRSLTHVLIDPLAPTGLRSIVAPRLRWSLVLVALTGCRGLLGIEDPTVVPGSDAAIDAHGEGGCTRRSERFDACALGMPMADVHLTAGGYTLDTTPNPAVLRSEDFSGQVLASSSFVYVQSDGQPAVVFYLGSLTVDTGAKMRVIGTRAAIVVADGAMVISGILDAGSHLAEINLNAHVSQNVQLGAGANQTCNVQSGMNPPSGGPGADGLATSGSGGGGGAGGRGVGGHGGTGDNAGATGGMAGNEAATPATVRGGCPGGASGAAGVSAISPASQSTVSVGGAGGGALHLTSFTSIRVDGQVLAGGAGGAGAAQGSACGGGGGGAGGYLGLEAPSVTIHGGLAANGGGGGAGSQTSSYGSNGTDGALGTTGAPGGSTNSCGTAGAAGGAVSLIGGSVTASDLCGGGGGGGGAGFLLIWAPTYVVGPDATISPMPLRDLP